MPSFDKPFIAQADGSNIGIGAVLWQEHPDGLYLVLTQQEAVKLRKELLDRERVPSLGVYSAKIPEVPVREGIYTAERPPALGIHPALQDKKWQDNVLGIILALSPEL